MKTMDECSTFAEALAHLVAEDAPLSSSALYALSAASAEEVQLFRARWPAVPVPRRRGIIAQLAESAEANFELDFGALFRVTIDDEDVQVRTLSVEGLWEDDDAGLVEPLVRILRLDGGASARAAAATSLGRFVLMGEFEELDERYAQLVRGALLESIEDGDEHVEVRRRALESIAYLGNERVRDLIAESYAHGDESVRISAVFAMGRSGDTTWAQTVHKELLSHSPAMRYEAARACGELEVKEAVPDLIRLVSQPDREVQFAAIAALGQIGGGTARRALERWCRSEDEVISLVAEDALAELELGEQPLDLFIFEPEAAEDEDEGFGVEE